MAFCGVNAALHTRTPPPVRHSPFAIRRVVPWRNIGSPASPITLMAAPLNPPAAPAPPAWRPPRAWQPLTFRGVAAFAGATATRVFIVQFLVLLVAVACLLQALELTWWPAVRTAIRTLPEVGRVQHGQLDWHGEPFAVLADSPSLSILVDAAGQHEPGQVADVQVEIAKTEIRVCTLVGCLPIVFEPVWDFPLNRVELVPWWGAWKPAIVAVTALLLALALGGAWWTLATLYSVPLRLLAILAGRPVTLGGGWRIAAMALMPGALLLSLGILAYGLIRLPLLLLVGIFVLHLLLGWVYSIAAIFRLDTYAAIAAAASPATPAPAKPAVTPPVEKPPEPSPAAPPEPEPEIKPAPRRAAANPFAAPEE